MSSKKCGQNDHVRVSSSKCPRKILSQKRRFADYKEDENVSKVTVQESFRKFCPDVEFHDNVSWRFHVHHSIGFYYHLQGKRQRNERVIRDEEYRPQLSEKKRTGRVQYDDQVLFPVRAKPMPLPPEHTRDEDGRRRHYRRFQFCQKCGINRNR
ncbi:hypothetical protein QTP88_022350 [Uroleucon formosanum]